MSRAPDLSSFKIARKGSARPIETEPAPAPASWANDARPAAEPPAPSPPDRPSGPPPEAAAQPLPSKGLDAGEGRGVNAATAPVPQAAGRLLATTLKLDEARYLRLQDAARAIPGRPRRRTTQEVLTEALDEWLERRGL